MGKFITLREEFESETGAHPFADQQYIDWLEKVVERQLRLYNVSNRYSIEDVEKCVEYWGLCKVEKEYIERFLNGC